MVSPYLYLAEVIAFPGVLALALSYFTVREARATSSTPGTPIEVESDLRNENLDPSVHGLSYWLFFAIYFNVIYLTVNLSLVQRTLFNSPFVYAACLAAFILALFFALLFVLRFHERRYAIIGVIFSVIGTVVITSSVQLGFGHWVAYGATASSASSAYTLAGQAQDMVIPIVMAGAAWVLTLVAFLMDLGVMPEHLPFRFEGNRAYQTLLATIILGWVGVMLAVLHPLMSLL